MSSLKLGLIFKKSTSEHKQGTKKEFFTVTDSFTVEEISNCILFETVVNHVHTCDRWWRMGMSSSPSASW